MPSSDRTLLDGRSTIVGSKRSLRAFLPVYRCDRLSLSLSLRSSFFSLLSIEGTTPEKQRAEEREK